MCWARVPAGAGWRITRDDGSLCFGCKVGLAGFFFIQKVCNRSVSPFQGRLSGYKKHIRDKTVPMLLNKMAELALPVVAEAGCALVDIAFMSAGPNALLQLFIDKTDGGPSIADCAKISKRLGRILELDDTLPRAYRLEVSSPGVERPLKTYDDQLTRENFVRFSGKRAVVKTYQLWVSGSEAETHKLDKSGNRVGRKVFRGLLQGLEADDVLIQVDGETLRIPLDRISKAHLEFKF